MRARSWCRSPAGRCRCEYDGIRAEHLRGAERLRRLRRLPHGRDRDRGPAGGRTAPAAALQRRLEDPGRRRPVLVPLPRGRRRARRPLHLPARRRPLPDRHQRLRTTSAIWSGSRRTRSSSRSRSGTGSTLRDARGPGAGGARDRRRGSTDGELPARFRTAELAVAGSPTLVCGTGYTGEDGVELLVAPEDARTVWDALLGGGAGPAGPRRPRHAAAGGQLLPLRQRPDARSGPRSRPGSAGASRRRRASSARRHAGSPRAGAGGDAGARS